MCYYKWKAWYKLLSSLGLKKKLCSFLSSTTSHLLRRTKNIAIEHQFLCSNTMKTNELKVYISLQENKLVCFTNRVHFSNTIWLMISEKSIIVYTFLPYGEWCTDVPKVSINKAYKKNCLLEFQILLALN